MNLGPALFSQNGAMGHAAAGGAAPSGLHDLDITSTDQERRGMVNGIGPSLHPPPLPSTVPLEVKEIPPGLAQTLENMVGQLDVLTQTVNILEQRLTMTENKLREVLDNQQKITLQVRPTE
nr:POC1 centriolar protein homolog B-like [Lytechinus pictus]